MKNYCDEDFLISMHLSLPPYNQMELSDALKAIKHHCGIEQKQESVEKCKIKKEKYKFNVKNDLLAELTRYQNITLSEEEDVFSGSEEHYIEKWRKILPYSKMTKDEAEKIIISKLNIIHRNREPYNKIKKDETDQIIRSKPNTIYGHRENISNLSGSCGSCSYD